MIKKNPWILFVTFLVIFQVLKIHDTNKLKSQLIFSKNDISKITITCDKKTLSQDYQFSTKIIQKINHEIINSRKETVDNFSSNELKNKVCIHVFLDGTIERHNEMNEIYKTSKREINFLPKDNKNTYIALTVRHKNSEKYESKLFLVQSNWISQNLFNIVKNQTS